MTRPRGLLIVAATIGALAALHGQARDAGAAKPRTAIIDGVLSSDGDGKSPVRHAVMLLRGAGVQPDMETTTDERGYFQFTQLPPGQFTIGASKPAFIPVSYGARKPGQPGTPIALAEAQHLTIAMAMKRGGVIAGRVSGIDGLASQGTLLWILSVKTVRGERVVDANNGRTTPLNDRGEFRAFGLRPGEYVIACDPKVGWTDVRMATTAEWAWAHLPGDQALRSPSPVPGSTWGYASVYYPGTTDLSAASTIAVDAGEERQGVDFSIELTPTATASGVITDGNGAPVSGVRLSLAKMPATVLTRSGTHQVAVSADGRFWAPGLAPGRYQFSATSQAVGAPFRWAALDFVVNGEDIRGLALTLEPGLSIAGRVELRAGGSTTLQAPASVSVSARAVALAGQPAVSSPAVTSSADGHFVIPNLMPGRYRLSVGVPAASGWFARSAMLADQDLIDAPIDLQPGSTVTDVIVTVTDRPARLGGRLVNSDGSAGSDLNVVIFTADPSLWNEDARRIRQTHTSTTGQYAFGGLPPGDYYVTAVAEIAAEDLGDPAFYASLAPAATKITIAEGENRTLDLRVRK